MEQHDEIHRHRPQPVKPRPIPHPNRRVATPHTDGVAAHTLDNLDRIHYRENWSENILR
jgi:hypothetical protein